MPLKHLTPWNLEYRRTVRTREKLERLLSLTPAEKGYFERLRESLHPFSEDTPTQYPPEGRKGRADEQDPPSPSPPLAVPLAIPHYYLSLLSADPEDPLRLQCVPRQEELESGPLESADPLNDQEHSPVPRLVRRYPDRALLLVTGLCALNCRFCFRRHFLARAQGPIRQSELDRVTRYLKKNPEVKEILLSGGDPLTLPDEKFFPIVDTLRFARPGIVLRVSSRLPVVLPNRITRRFAFQMRSRQPFWFVLHVNHPRELTPLADQALNRLADAGVPLVSQTVLLKGVNDSVETLEALFRGLMARRVKPYYLFQADLAQGTAHFRVPLEKGLEIVRELRLRLSGLALPAYALDLPGGGGKLVLGEAGIGENPAIRGEKGTSWVLRGPNGSEYLYPKH